jgi:PhzF family phenazine biosynthesis protein
VWSPTLRFRPSGPLTGAPLSLVTDADALTDVQMRAIAREFNQSETTFLLRPSLPGATRQLRSFTPTGEEVFGAGQCTDYRRAVRGRTQNPARNP